MTIQTIKFSEMTPGGDLPNNSSTPGLLAGGNVLFNNPWTFLASGSTAARPVPSVAVNGRLRFNTDTLVYEYYDTIPAMWVQLSGTGTGTVNPGTANDIAFYAANGTAVSPIASAANSVLVTNGSELPSLSTTLPSGLSIPGAAITASTAALLSGSVVAAPVAGVDLTNKTYVDSLVSGTVLSITGTTNQVIASSPTGNVTLSLPQDIATGSTPTFTGATLGFIKSVNSILDSSSNTMFAFNYQASAVNYFSFSNGPTLTNLGIRALGTDTDIGFSYIAKGAGIHDFYTTGNQPIGFASGTAFQHSTAFIFANTAAARTVTFQDASGTLAYLSDIPGGSPSALTKVNDTNVTLTLGGTPATALLQATSLTLGWTGTLAETRGGTAQSTYALGDTLYSSAANTLSKLSGNTTAVKQYLSQTGTGVVSAVPAWATISGSDITGAALTKTDDTNVTLSLGGTPTTALLRAASLTLGWTGTLSGTRGGTGVNNGASTFTMGGSHTLSGAFASTFTFTNTTSVTFPTSGTLATTSQLPTPAALTKTDDTNVTLTLGGTPATALLQATSLTLGWTGTLAASRGGTGISSLGAGIATWLGAPSSANLIAAMTDETGTGSLVFANTPTLVTPVLGAATATSINFGQTTLNNYQEGTWIPADGSGAALTFTSVVANYTRVGRMVTASCALTYPATANGSSANITGLPFTCANNTGSLGGLVIYTNSTTLSRCLVAPNTTNFNLFNSVGAQITNTAMSGSVNYFQLTYFV